MGTVPACFVASSLFLEYHEHKRQGLNAQYPLGGVILQGPVYSGTALVPSLFLGQKILPCGCLFSKNDPYDNASVITKIEVAFKPSLSCSVPCF